MLQKSIDNYYEEFIQEIQALSQYGDHQSDVFWALYTDALCGTGFLVDCNQLIFRQNSGSHRTTDIKIDGYESVPSETNNILTLVVSEFSGVGNPELQTINRDEAISHFSKVETFIEKSLSKEFRDSIDENMLKSPRPIAEMIANEWENIVAFRIILMTDKLLRIQKNRKAEKSRSFENITIRGTRVIRDCYDFEQYKNENLDGSKSTDAIEIDFIKDTGNAVPVLSIQNDKSLNYDSYIGVISGNQLASIYERYQSRLLEQNIRSYLQNRNNVNKAITNTIMETPGMFFAYNNGISCVAEEIEIKDKSIISIKGFQIVNGGQTTASIHRALTDKSLKADLSLINVQMKITVLKDDLQTADKFDIVTRIAEFSNNQTKVARSDLVSNNPFHIQIEKLSRSIRAPIWGNNSIQTKWYYERLKGQYLDEKTRIKNPKDKLRFETEFPALTSSSVTNRKQVFDKSYLAKMQNTWNQYPYIVAQGNEKNYAWFKDLVSEEWEKWDEVKENYGEQFFEDLVSKIIIFQDIAKLIPAIYKDSDGRPQRGLPGQAITYYAISKFAYDIQTEALGKKKKFDHRIIWQLQKMPEDLLTSFVPVIKLVFNLMMDPPEGGSKDTSEWAKKPFLWDLIKNQIIKWPDSISNYLIPISEENSSLTLEGQTYSSEELNGASLESVKTVQENVNTAGIEFWKSVYQWGQESREISGSEINVFSNYFKHGSANRFRSKSLLETLERFQSKGCELHI